MSGRYASYWNAFLLFTHFLLIRTLQLKVLTDDFESSLRVHVSHVVEGAADVHALVVLLDRAEVQGAAHLIHNAPGTVVTDFHLSASSLKHVITEVLKTVLLAFYDIS